MQTILRKNYQVAGHVFSVEMGENESLWKLMHPYLPFECTPEQPAGESLFTLQGVYQTPELMEEGEKIACFNHHLEQIEAWKLSGEKLRIDFGIQGRVGISTLITDKQGNAKLVINENESLRFFGLNNALMFLYTFFTAPKETLLMHASVSMFREKGYLFQGRSGTGKSTHSRLWLENIPGTELLNDDNPVIRVVANTVMAYGTPWSGKTPCYRNQGVPLGGMVRITQAPKNEIERLPTLKSYASILPSCSCIRWEKEQQQYVHKTIEKVILQVACYTLRCLPDADAAMLCNHTIVL